MTNPQETDRPLIVVVDLRNIPLGLRKNKVFSLSRAARMFILNNPGRFELTVLARRAVEMELCTGATMHGLYADYRIATRDEMSSLQVDQSEIDYSSFYGQVVGS